MDAGWIESVRLLYSGSVTFMVERLKKEMKAMRYCCLFLMLWCCVMPGSRVSAQSKTLMERPIADAPSFAKLALVIGVGEYEHASRLAPHTHKDARAFAQLLRTQFGFPDAAITLMTDEAGTPDRLRPTYAHLRSALNSLVNRVTEKTEVIIYFSGQGVRVEDQDWLVPLDGDPGDVKGLCINYAEFHNRLETRNPGRALVIVDACRNLEGGKSDVGSGVLWAKWFWQRAVNRVPLWFPLRVLYLSRLCQRPLKLSSVRPF